MKKIFIASLVSLALFVGVYSIKDQIKQKNTIQKTLAWQDKRIETTQSHHYRRLIKRFKLNKTNKTLKIGKTQNHDLIVMPTDLPQNIGTVYTDGKSILFNADQSILDQKEQTPLKRLELLYSDTVEKVTSKTIKFKDYDIFLSWSKETGPMFNIYSNKLKNIAYLEKTDFFEPKPEFVFKAKFIPQKKEIKYQSNNTQGKTKRVSPGSLVFVYKDKQFVLDVYSIDDKSIFLVFGDQSNQSQSYPAGRFILVDLPDKNGNTSIDFNQAHNPWCAFNSHLTCPLAAPQNKLPFSIDAGEKYNKAHQLL